MLKKIAIVGFVFLLIGGAVLGWVLAAVSSEQREAAAARLKYGSEPDEYLKRYNEWLAMSPKDRTPLPWESKGDGRNKTQDELRREQQGRLKGDLERLADGELSAHPLAEILYGDNWQDQVREYNRRKRSSEFIMKGAVVCMSVGGLAFGFCLLVWVTRLATAGISRLKTASDNVQAADESIEPAPDPINAEEQSDNTEQSGPSFVEAVKSSSQGTGTAPSPLTVDADGSVKQRKKIPVLVSGKKPTYYQKASPESPEHHGVSRMEHSGFYTRAGGAPVAEMQKDSSGANDSLRVKTTDLEKQMDEFRRMAHNVQQSAIEHSKPVNGALQELTEQVSAIREYAAHQQERVNKLQDGYDWNIVRTFCLRVIRCIDNLESRIERLEADNVETGHLDEVKDELIFALESSGVEQFKPEIDSLYRGQEKSTEAVKERVKSNDPKKAGRIAKVVRPGYQYVIDEGNFKVVRASQVKLFG